MRSFDYSKLSKMCWDNEILLLCSKIHECKGRQDLFVRQKPAQLDRLIEVARIQSTERDVLEECPSIGRTSVFNALKKLGGAGYIEKHGEGKNAFYVKVSSDELF